MPGGGMKRPQSSPMRYLPWHMSIRMPTNFFSWMVSILAVIDNGV
jgi:hypothetical protein